MASITAFLDDCGKKMKDLHQPTVGELREISSDMQCWLSLEITIGKVTNDNDVSHESY